LMMHLEEDVEEGDSLSKQRLRQFLEQIWQSNPSYFQQS
jgi:hypothetical protein